MLFIFFYLFLFIFYLFISFSLRFTSNMSICPWRASNRETHKYKSYVLAIRLLSNVCIEQQNNILNICYEQIEEHLDDIQSINKTPHLRGPGFKSRQTQFFFYFIEFRFFFYICVIFFRFFRNFFDV